MPRTLRHKLFNIKPRISAFTVIEKAHFTFLLAEALYKVLAVQKGKKLLHTAFTDFELLEFTELFIDIGYVIEEAKVYYDERQAKDPKKVLTDSLMNLRKSKFDVIFGKGHIDLQYFAQSLSKAMKAIRYYNFRTCLNIHKLSVLAALVYLIPDNSSIIEAGAYKCGSSILMGQFSKVLDKKIKIFALDTFEGIPAATQPDRLDSSVYDFGMFVDNPIEEIQQRVDDQGLSKTIQLIKGDVTDTLETLEAENVALLFLDTDQYKGTQAGLNYAKTLPSKPHIIVDDSSLKGVSKAIDEFSDDMQSYKRHNLFTNFDYLFASLS